jgi:hypothetical protein
MDMLWLFDKRFWLLTYTSSGLAWFVELKYNSTETHKEDQNNDCIEDNSQGYLPHLKQLDLIL